MKVWLLQPFFKCVKKEKKKKIKLPFRPLSVIPKKTVMLLTLL